MRKKPWVKVMALALALALLWMNMADVRNIVDANADGAGNGGNIPNISDIVLKESTGADGADAVVITVTTDSEVADVKVNLKTNAVGGDVQVGVEEFTSEDHITWTKELSVRDNNWTAGTTVYVQNAFVRDADKKPKAVAIVHKNGADSQCDSAEDAKYYVTLGAKKSDEVTNPEEEGSEKDNENEDKLAVTEVKCKEAESDEAIANYATITVTTSSRAKSVNIELAWMEAENEQSLTLGADPAGDDESGTRWIAELSRDFYKDKCNWAEGTQVYIKSVTAEDEDRNTAKGEVSNAEDKTVATAGTAAHSFEVKENSDGGNGDPNPTEEPLTIKEIKIGAQNNVVPLNSSVAITVTTSSKADHVTVTLGAEDKNGVAISSSPYELKDFEPNPEGTVWTYTLEMKDHSDWDVDTKVYIASVTAEAEDGTTAKGEVSEAEDDKYHATAGDAIHSFTVTLVDMTPPVVRKIEIDPQGETLTDGQTVTISVKAYDDSKIDYVGVYLNGYGYISGDQFRYDTDKEAWVCELTISNSFRKGKIYVEYVRAVDRAEHVGYGSVSTTGETYAYEDNASYWFEVDREEVVEVKKKPTVKAVKLTEDETTVKSGGTIHIEVQASAGDAGLRVKRGCRLYLHTEMSVNNLNDGEYCWLDWNEEKECYIGSMKITDTMYPGKWKVSDAEVYDNSGAYTTYYPEDKPTFTIENEKYDTEAPKITSVEMDKRGEEVHAGQEVKLSVEATDNEGVETIFVYLHAAVKSLNDYVRWEEIELNRVEDSDRYEGNFEIGGLTYSAEWYIDEINIQDISGNYRHIRGCQDGTYTDDYWSYDYGKKYSKDSYSLEEHFYVLVNNGGFDEPRVSVMVKDFSADGTDYGYQRTDDGYWKEVEVPRRASLSEINELLGDGAGPDELDFKGWISGRGTSDESDDPMVLWEDNFVSAKYDKNVILLELYDSWDIMNYMKGTKIYTGKLFGKEGETVSLPTEIEGFSNIEWRIHDGLKPVAVKSITVGHEPVQVISGSADMDSSVPATSDTPGETDTPNTTNTPVRPPLAEPVSLPAQRIAEVVSEIAAAGNGATVTVDMEDATVVPKDILESAKGKDVDVVLQMEGYTWTINGKDIQSENLKDVNLRVIRNTEYIPGVLISRLAGDNPVEQITLEYNGEFGFRADLTMNIGSQYAGKTGNLYWHDSDGRMLFMNAGAVDASGNVTLGFSHASDYAIVITGTSAATPPVTAAPVIRPVVGTPKTGDELPVVPYAALFAAGLAVLVITGVGMKRRRMK